MKIKLLGLAVLGMSVLGMTSCDPEKNGSELGNIGVGTLVTCEGQFPNGAGNISFIGADGKVQNNVFEAANGRPLGNIVQSLTLHDGKAYIVVNNASTLEIADANTMKSITSINGLDLPRYFVVGNAGKGYLSCWGEDGMSGDVRVIDLSSNTVESVINTGGKGAESMIIKGDNLYVANRGGFAHDNLVSVIDMTSNTLTDSMRVGDDPVGMVVDAANNIWVLCMGKSVYDNNYNLIVAQSTPASLWRISGTNSEEIWHSSVLGAYNTGGLCLNPNLDKLYFNHNGNVWTMAASAGTTPTPLIAGSFYGLAVDANTIYVADPNDYISEGWVYTHRIDNGARIDSFRVGVVPNGFTFKRF